MHLILCYIKKKKCHDKYKKVIKLISQYLLPTLLLSSLNDNFSMFPPVFFCNKKVDFSETAENIRVPHLSTTRVIGTVNTHLKENQFLSVKKSKFRS